MEWLSNRDKGVEALRAQGEREDARWGGGRPQKLWPSQERCSCDQTELGREQGGCSVMGNNFPWQQICLATPFQGNDKCCVCFLHAEMY